MLLSWGSNTSGQCCVGEQENHNKSRPRLSDSTVRAAVGASTVIVSVACGEAHTLLLTEYCDVFCCGRAKEGQLGLGETCLPTVRVPCVITALRAFQITHIACGTKHSLAVSRHGEAFEWGLLQPLQDSQEESQDVDYSKKFGGYGKDFEEDLNEKERRIVAESWKMYMNNEQEATTDGGAESMGDTAADLSAMDALGRRRVKVLLPRVCRGLDGEFVQAASAGFAHSVFVSSKGYVYANGYNEKSQLGIGTRFPSAECVRVSLPKGATVSMSSAKTAASFVSCGHNHTACIVGSGRRVVTWGFGTFGQLGLGHDRKEASVPLLVDHLKEPAALVACGDQHTVVYTTLGELYTFGHRDAVGGKSHYERLPELQREIGVAAGRNVQRIFAGGMGCFAMVDVAGETARAVSELYGWGYNRESQLGRVTMQREVARPSRVNLPQLAGATCLSLGVGPSHCVASLDLPHVAVAAPELGEPPTSNLLMLKLLRGAAPFDVTVMTKSTAEKLAAHRCIVAARCTSLLERLRPAEEAFSWELDLQGYSHTSIAALLEYLYCDFCLASTQDAAELRPLAEQLGLERLVDGIAFATETQSVAEDRSWVRTETGQWVMRDVSCGMGSRKSESSYAKDLANLLRIERQVAPLAVGGTDFVNLLVKPLDHSEASGGTEAAVLRVARPILLSVDFFRALLEDGFAEASQRDGDMVVFAENVDSLVLCLQLLIEGEKTALPRDPNALLGLVVEAHRLCLPEFVRASELALCNIVTDCDVTSPVLGTLDYAAGLYEMDKLAKEIALVRGKGTDCSVASRGFSLSTVGVKAAGGYS